MAEKNEISCVVGRKGSGKSFLVKRSLQKPCWAFVVWDPMNEYGFVPRRNSFTDLEKLEEFLEWSRREPERGRGFAGRFVPHFELEENFDEVCNLVYQRGSLQFVVEEVPMVSEPGYAPPAFDRVIRLGRHRGINLICTGQRLTEFPRRLTAASDYFYIFETREPRDLQGIAERCGPEVAEAVAGVGGHDYVFYGVADRHVEKVEAESAGVSQ